MINFEKIVEDYLKKVDWRVKENANISYSSSSLILRLAGEGLAQYTLSKIYPKKICQAHLKGDLHLHNLSMGILGYCAGWSIADILREGFGGVAGKIESSPPKHLSTALLQIANFIGTMCNEWAGAQAFNDLDVYLAPYVRLDKLSYPQLKQEMQQFIYNLNISSRWGGQSPFTNITFDLKIPEDLANQAVIYAGKTLDSTYKEYQPEVDMINKTFMEVMIEGDSQGRVFTFPIPTYSITKDFDWKSENADLLFEMTAKFGIPYFQNCVQGGIDPRQIRSMCCRLMLDLKELHRRLGGFFGYADKTGSVGVVTINLPRVGSASKSEGQFFKKLEALMELAKESLEIKRKVVQENIDKGLLPFTKRYLGMLKWHFSTIGLIGMHEACLNFLGKGIETEEGKTFAIKTLKFMREKLLKFQKETGNIYNLEATPAEGASYRLARMDGEKKSYYTNSSHLPVNFTSDLVVALKHQDDLQVLYTGGTILHAFLGERISRESCKALVKKIVENFRLPYFTITPTFSLCPEHGYLKGEQSKCPVCQKETEVYSRVVGYLRPVKNWNAGKQEEFKQRLQYATAF